MKFLGSPISWDSARIMSPTASADVPGCQMPRGQPISLGVCVSLYMALFAGYAVYHIPLNGHMNRGNYDWAVDVLGDPIFRQTHICTSLSIIYTLYTALCVICYALTTKLLSRIEVHGEKRLSAWPLGLEIHITRCDKSMLWDPRDQVSLLRSWYNITIIYSHTWITYMNNSHDKHNSHNDNTNTRLNIVWQGATWQRTALMIAARHGDSDHRTIGTHGVSAATQVPCSKDWLMMRSWGMVLNVLHFHWDL